MSEQADKSADNTESWLQVIVRDMREFARRTGHGTVESRRLTGLWGLRVAAWFRFVHRRRPDTRFAVFPGYRRSAEILAVFASIVLGLVLVADTIFLTTLHSRDAFTLTLFEHLTRLGQSAWILYATGAVLLAVSFYPSEGLPRYRRTFMHGVILIAYYLFTTVAFSGLLTNLFKALFGRARPQFVPEGMVWFSMPFGDHYDYASFPSGHATTAGAFAVGLALLMPKLRVFILLAGIWIAISRPVLGVHFPSDIFAGFAFGGAFSWFYARAFARKRLLFGFDDKGGLRVRPVLKRGRNGRR
jgi:undecaprenyl-diphosphatase